jgi:hypothetical protein
MLFAQNSGFESAALFRDLAEGGLVAIEHIVISRKAGGEGPARVG